MRAIHYFVIVTFFLDYILYFIYNMHMFQLNYYNTKTQLQWINKKKIVLLKKSIIYITILLICLLFKNSYVVLALYCIKVILDKPVKAKKPLVFTKRVKRTIVVSTFIYLLIVFLWFSSTAYLFILPILSILTPFMIIVSNTALLPLFKYINKRYEKKAINKIRGMKDLIVIGITGSYGKTSTKNYLYEMLSTKYNCYKTPGNINTKIGLVKDINDNLKATHEIYICEMGADHIGDIKESCDLVNPKYGIITSIGQQHLETFKTIDNIINTKFELSDGIKDGRIFLNYDNEYIRNHKTSTPKVTYGIDNKADIMAKDIKIDENGMSFNIIKDNEVIKLNTSILGKHNVQNILSCVSLALELGINEKSIIKAVKNLKNVSHRLELKKYDNKIIIDDAYNSNPVGASSALEVLNSINAIKIIITPGMVELGEREDDLNYEFGIKCAQTCDYIILVGKNQTKAISNGVKSTKFDLNKLIIVDTIEDAFKEENKVKSGNKLKAVLLENDLPDQY